MHPLGYKILGSNHMNNTTPRAAPTIEVVEVPPSHRNHISRGLQTDYNNTSVANWIVTEKSSSTTSDRYREFNVFLIEYEKISSHFGQMI